MPFNTDPYSSIFDAMDQAHNEREQQTATRHGVIQQLAEQNRLPQGQGKAQSLIQRQRDKLKGFDERQGLSNMDMRDDFDVTVGKKEELWNDSLANKIHNDYSVEDIDYIIGEANKEYGLHKDSTGTYYSRQKNGGFGIDEETGQVVPQADGPLGVFRGDLSQYNTLYRYGTKDGNEKWGLSYGDDPSVRYSDEYLAKTGSFIGPKGVNRDDLQASYLLPRKLTETLEATIHGSEAYKKLRLYREDMNNREAYRQAKADFGSGVTEAYRRYERDPFAKVNQALWDEYKQRFNPTGDGMFRAPIQDVEDKYKQAHLQRVAEEGLGFGGRALNAAGSFASTLVNEVAMAPAQWIGESTGWWDMGSSDEVAKRVDDWFNVNPYVMENVTNEVKDTASEIVKKYNEAGEIDYSLVAKGIGQGLSGLPELLAMSLGFVASFAVPGAAIGKIQKARKVKDLAYTFKGIDAAVAAGTKTAQAAKAEKAAAKAVANTFTKMEKFVQSGLPFGVLTGNQLARDIEAFRENNGGNVTAADVLRMAPVSAAHVFVDSQASAFLLRDFVKLTRLSKGFAKDVAKDMATATPQQYSNLTRAFLGSLKAASIVGGHAALEGGQEYFQTMLEVFNSQYASKKYGTDVARILGSEMAQIEGLTAAMLGSGMGGAVSGAGRVKQAAVPTFKKAFDHYQKERAKGVSPSEAAAAGTAPVAALTPQEQQQARIEFNTLFTELHNTLSEADSLNEENFFQVFADYRRFLYQRGFIEDQLNDEQRTNLDRQINGFEEVLFGAAQRLNISELETEGLKERALPTETSESVEAALVEMFPHIPLETLRARVRTLSEDELAAEFGMSAEELVTLGEAQASIAGAQSAQANAGLLDSAKALQETGMAPEQVWEETGWYQESDGQWRYEIADDKADTTPQLKERFARNEVPQAVKPVTTKTFRDMGFAGSQKLSEVLKHDALLEAYPELGNIDVVVQKPAPGTQSRGMVDTANNRMLIEANSPAEARSILLHEAQHLVQKKEGFDSGANEETPLTGPNRQGYTPNDVYERSLGEIEARNTQFRADEMHPKYAKTAPWQTADQFSDIAIRNPDGSVSLSAGPAKAGTSSAARRTSSKGKSPEARLAELGHRILDHAVDNYSRTGKQVRTGDKDRNTRYSRLERLHAALKDSFYAQRPHGIKNLADEFSIPAEMMNEWNQRIAAMNAAEKGKPVKPSDVRFSKETGKVQAVTVKGNVYVIPDNIPAGSAGSVLLHEMGVHMAQADKRLGEHFRKFVGALRQMEKTGDEQAKEVIARAKQRVTDALGDRKDQVDKRLWDEEFVAYTVEEAVASGIKPSATGSDIETFLDHVLNFFRTALTLVFKSENAKDLAGKLTIQQVVDLAHGFAQKELIKASERTAPVKEAKEEATTAKTAPEEEVNVTTEEDAAPVVTSSLPELLDEVVGTQGEFSEETQTAVNEAVEKALPEAEESAGKASSIRKGTEQTPAQRKALQEAVVREFIEFMGKHSQDGKLSESKRKELDVLGSRYSIAPEAVEKILKSYASVLQESTIDDTGIRTRFARIQRLLNSGTATDAAVQKEYRELTEWMYTTEASIEQLQDTIRAAEEWIETENRKPKFTVGKSKDFKSEYRTHVESTSKGAHFVIKATYDKTTKKWSAAGGIGEARKRIAEKEATRNAIDKVITYVHDNGGQHLREEELYTDTGFRFGTASGKNKEGVLKNIKAERAYIEQAMEAIKEMTGQKRSINKMILSDTTSQRWKPTSKRARDNRGIINRLARGGEAYTSDDVVILHSLGKFRVGGNKFRSDLYGTKLEAANEIAAAMEAGATIVLESTVRARNAAGKTYRLVGNTSAAKDTYPDNKKWRKEGYDAFSSQRLEEFLLSKGYMQLAPSGAGASVFVPFSQEIADKIQAKQDAAADVAARRAAKDKELNKLIRAHSLVVAMRSYGYEPEGITLAEAEERLAVLEDSAKNKYFTPKALREELQAQAAIQATEEAYVETGSTEAATSAERSAEDLGVSEEVIAEAAKETAVDQEVDLDGVLTEETISDKASENIYAFMERNTEKAINEMVEHQRSAKAAGVLFEAKNKAIAHIAALRLGELEVTADRGTALLNVWAQAAKARASMKDQLAVLKEAVSNIYVNGTLLGKRRISDKGIDTTPDNAVVVGDIANTILGGAAGAGRKLKAYSVQSYAQKGEKTIVKDRWRWDKEGLTLGDILNNKGEVVETITQINPVSLDPNSFLQVGRATPLNTVPTGDLPLVFGKLINKVAEAFDARIPALTEAERKGQKPTAYVKDGNTDQFNMVNSPARALVYQKDGTVNPAFYAAMGIALGEALRTDRKAISAGHKTDDDLANMFGVRPEEVTQGMREHAQVHGAFRKSIGRTLGKSALTALGITRNRKSEGTDPVAKGQYEAIEADLGNMIIEVGIELGIFQGTEASSNAVAKLYHEGEIREEGEEITRFINLVEKPYEAGKEREDIPAVAEMVADQNEIEGYMPNVAGRRTGPRIGEPHSEAELKYMAERIRNDETGALVPAEAQKAMKNFMKTPFQLNKTLAKDFFTRLEDPAVKEAVMEFLGYIPIDGNHPEYAKLLAEDKKKQEGINNSIERSLDALEELTGILEGVEEGEASRLYFDFFYSGNQRYNIDSNTVNMMADKLHRFFISPESLNLTYTVNRSNNTFEHHYVENGEKKVTDSSLYVRAALAQAFGVGIDKTATREIIRIGNALLSLSNEQVKALQDQLYTLGKFDKSKTFAIRAPGADGKMEAIKLTPDHFSHALQALQFLDEYTSSDADTITTSLTFEMDALTSGFSNKVQQFALLNGLSEHARRVGIIHQHFNVNATDTEAGTNIHSLMNDPTRPEYSTNDMLANKSLGLDSYQSLASTTIRSLVTMVEGMKSPSAKSMFRALSPYFPGAKEVLDHNESGLSPDTFQPVIDSALRNMFKPGFMVFNYAASVSRIKKNLGMEIASGMLNKIASMDLSDVANKPLVDALTEGSTPLLSSIRIDKKPVKTVAELQKALREIEVRHIRVETRTEKGKESVRLDEYIGTELIEPTYGSAIEQTFATEFEKFIEIQNVTNDLFRSAFQLFDRMLMERIKNWRAENVAEAVTEAVILDNIDALKDVFPLIAGPLSDTLRDGVHIYETDTRTPSYVMQTQRAPQTLRKPGHGSDAKTLTIHPLIRNIVSAVNSGAVLPLHALDGAQMAVMSNNMASQVIQSVMGQEGAGILPIHDAAMVPLAFADYYAYAYNKGTVELNKNYSIMGEMVKMGERMREVFAAVEQQNAEAAAGKGKKASLDLASITPIRSNTTLSGLRKEQKETRDNLNKRLKNLQEAENPDTAKIQEVKGMLKDLEKESSFLRETDKLINTAIGLNEQVNNARENVYQDGDFVGVLVGLRGGMYRVGDRSETPNLDYLAALADDGVYQVYSNVALDASIPLKSRSKSKKAQSADLVLGAQDGTYKADQLQNLKSDTLLSLAGINSVEELIGGQSDVARVDVSQHVIAVAPEGRYKTKMDMYQAMAVEGTQISAGQTVMVTAVPKAAEGLGKDAGAELLGRETAIIQTSWDTAVEEAQLALADNAILVFNDTVGEPLSNDAYVDGEAYIYHQLLASEDLNVATVEVGDTTLRLVSRLVPEGQQVTESAPVVEESGNLEPAETVDESGVVAATAVVKEGADSAAIAVLDRLITQLQACER